MTLSPITGEAFTLGSALTNTGGNVNNVFKTGAGTTTLTPANTYTGGTTVNNGTLLVNNSSGSGTGTGAVTVDAGGRLGGTGTLAPTGSHGVNITGVLAPGGSVGTGNFTMDLAGTSGSVTMNSGASFQYDLGVSGSDIGHVGSSDLLSIAGSGASAFAFNGNTIDFLNTGSLGFYKLFHTGRNNADTWTGLTFSSTGLITGGLTVSNLADGYSGNLIMGGNTLGGTAGDIYLQVVPEPAAALLGGMGLLLLMSRRRVA